MTIIGTDSGIAWSPQAGATPAATLGSMPALAYKHWRWHQALNVEIAPQQLQAPLPMQVGGPLLPSGTYKGGAWAQGAVQLFPRFSNSHLHWLLWSALTSFSSSRVKYTAVDKDAWDYLYGGGSTLAGTYSASGDFTPSATGTSRNSINRYLALKRLLPPDEAGNYWGETIQDARVSAIVFEAGPGTPLRMTAGFVGRIPTLYDGTDVMTSPPGGTIKTAWRPEYISLSGDIPGLPNSDVLTSCVGTMLLPTGVAMDYSAVDVTIALSPSMTTPMQERILFSYYPESFNITGWNIAINLTIKKGVYQIYDEIFFGGDTAEWSASPWVGGEPFQIIFQSATNTLISNTKPVEMEVYAKTIRWSMEPLTTAAGQIVAARITGIVEAPSDGKMGWYLRVRNGRDPNDDESGDVTPNFLLTWPAT